MKRFHDPDSDRYHTAMAAALMCILVAGTFLLLASLAMQVDVKRPAFYLGGILLLVFLVRVAGWPGWYEFFAWLKQKPWRKRERTKTAYQWKKAPLPPPEEKIERMTRDSTWHPGPGE